MVASALAKSLVRGGREDPATDGYRITGVESCLTMGGRLPAGLVYLHYPIRVESGYRHTAQPHHVLSSDGGCRETGSGHGSHPDHIEGGHGDHDHQEGCIWGVGGVYRPI